MSRDTVYAVLVMVAMFLALGFAGAADYEARLILDEPLTVRVADGAR